MHTPSSGPYEDQKPLVPAPLLGDKQLVLLGRIATAHGQMESNLNHILDAFHRGWPTPDLRPGIRLSFDKRCKALRKSGAQAVPTDTFTKDIKRLSEQLHKLHKARNVVLHGHYSVAIDTSHNDVQIISAVLNGKDCIFHFDTGQLALLAAKLAEAAGVIEMLWRGIPSPWISSSDTAAAQRALEPHLSPQMHIKPNTQARPLASLL